MLKQKNDDVLPEKEKNDSVKIDSFNMWSDKSKNIPFKSNKNSVGNGEEKLAKECDISRPVGGQNSTVDLFHNEHGNISVKDMTKDDCMLGVEGSTRMMIIFRTIINPFVIWCSLHKSNCKLAEDFYNDIDKKNGSSKFTILEGIDRHELSRTNLSKLNQILNDLKKYKLREKEYSSLQSDCISIIMNSLGDSSLQDLLNECVRKEATNMTLIIVHEKKGWLIVKDTSKLSCPRITRHSPRINYDGLSNS